MSYIRFVSRNKDNLECNTVVSVDKIHSFEDFLFQAMIAKRIDMTEIRNRLLEMEEHIKSEYYKACAVLSNHPPKRLIPDLKKEKLKWKHQTIALCTLTINLDAYVYLSNNTLANNLLHINRIEVRINKQNEFEFSPKTIQDYIMGSIIQVNSPFYNYQLIRVNCFVVNRY